MSSAATATAATRGPPRTLDETFARCVDYVRMPWKGPGRAPIAPSRDERLFMYAHYKQATRGDCTSQRPPLLKVEARLKWEAWNRLHGMSQADAQRTYVRRVADYARSLPPRVMSTDERLRLHVWLDSLVVTDDCPSDSKSNSAPAAAPERVCEVPPRTHDPSSSSAHVDSAASVELLRSPPKRVAPAAAAAAAATASQPPQHDHRDTAEPPTAPAAAASAALTSTAPAHLVTPVSTSPLVSSTLPAAAAAAAAAQSAALLPSPAATATITTTTTPRFHVHTAVRTASLSPPPLPPPPAPTPARCGSVADDARERDSPHSPDANAAGDADAEQADASPGSSGSSGSRQNQNQRAAHHGSGATSISMRVERPPHHSHSHSHSSEARVSRRRVLAQMMAALRNQQELSAQVLARAQLMLDEASAIREQVRSAMALIQWQIRTGSARSLNAFAHAHTAARSWSDQTHGLADLRFTDPAAAAAADTPRHTLLASPSPHTHTRPLRRTLSANSLQPAPLPANGSQPPRLALALAPRRARPSRARDRRCVGCGFSAFEMAAWLVLLFAPLLALLAWPRLYETMRF